MSRRAPRRASPRHARRERAWTFVGFQEPDPELAALREQMECGLRARHGAAWLVRHRALLDEQWQYVRTLF